MTSRVVDAVYAIVLTLLLAIGCSALMSSTAFARDYAASKHVSDGAGGFYTSAKALCDGKAAKLSGGRVCEGATYWGKDDGTDWYWGSCVVNPDAPPAYWQCSALNSTTPTEFCVDGSAPVSHMCKTPQNCSPPQTMGSDGVCRTVACPNAGDVRGPDDLICRAPVKPPPAACPSGMIDGGVGADGNRICTVQVCNAPGVLQPDGSCYVKQAGDGPAGPTGPKGDKGEQGLQGVKGDKGDSGSQGDAGATGATGATGVNGVNGVKGSDGANGVNGINGLNGASGAAGQQGPMGLTGMTGAVGAMGLSGVAGAMGLTGAAGVAGASGTNGVDGKDGKSFCEENPGLAVCRDSTVSGACAATTCGGDAIQCATLRQAAALNCRAQQDHDELAASSLFSLGAGVTTGADPMAGDLPTPAKADVVDIKNVDANGWLGGGALFADKSITMQGHTIVIPLSKSLEYLLALRYALMVAASLVSFRLLSGAILGA